MKCRLIRKAGIRRALSQPPFSTFSQRIRTLSGQDGWISKWEREEWTQAYLTHSFQHKDLGIVILKVRRCNINTHVPLTFCDHMLKCVYVLLVVLTQLLTYVRSHPDNHWTLSFFSECSKKLNGYDLGFMQRYIFNRYSFLLFLLLPSVFSTFPLSHTHTRIGWVNSYGIPISLAISLVFPSVSQHDLPSPQSFWRQIFSVWGGVDIGRSLEGGK